MRPAYIAGIVAVVVVAGAVGIVSYRRRSQSPAAVAVDPATPHRADVATDDIVAKNAANPRVMGIQIPNKSAGNGFAAGKQGVVTQLVPSIADSRAANADVPTLTTLEAKQAPAKAAAMSIVPNRTNFPS